MPEKKTRERAARDKRQGKSASTQAGEYVREEIHHVREGKHGARSTKQAIAIGLSKARRAGVKLGAPKRGTTSKATRERAERDVEAGAKPKRATSKRRSRATTRALKREGQAATTKTALSRQARSASKKRSSAERSAAARKAARTKGPAKRSAAAKKAARTRRTRARASA
ncbi:MAG: hypothetical protein HOW73_24825 [Polyangiaceae bacterium]|nr:hypothetical protein [Polyangiaceae bacterium]